MGGACDKKNNKTTKHWRRACRGAQYNTAVFPRHLLVRCTSDHHMHVPGWYQWATRVLTYGRLRIFPAALQSQPLPPGSTDGFECKTCLCYCGTIKQNAGAREMPLRYHTLDCVAIILYPYVREDFLMSGSCCALRRYGR